MKSANVPIAKEGYPYIFFSCFVTLICALLDYKGTSILALFLSGLVLNFFRDPERVVPDDPDVIVAPADGKIIKIENSLESPFHDEQVQKISIFMNIFNVHVNRVPFPGTVTDIRFAPGKFFSADSSRAALENEYCAVTIDAGQNRKITFVQMAGLLARRIVCWAEKGDELLRGQRFGLIRFGSRVDIYLPQDATVSAAVGQKVSAGETVLATLSE